MSASAPRSWVGTPAEVLRFFVSGSAGSALFYGLYELLHFLGFGGAHAAPASWALGYLVSSFFTHRFHRTFTFRWPTDYWRSLRRTYVVYGSSLVATTALDWFLADRLGLHHRLAWILTLLAGGIANYLALRTWAFNTVPGTEFKTPA